MPRRWRTFAKAKAPPFNVRTAGSREASEGTAGFLFLVTSFWTKK